MIKEQMNKIKNMFSKKTEGEEKPKSEKRKIENLVFLLIVLIITLISINTILKGNDKDVDEEKLENILGKMSGVRKC